MVVLPTCRTAPALVVLQGFVLSEACGMLPSPVSILHAVFVPLSDKLHYRARRSEIFCVHSVFFFQIFCVHGFLFFPSNNIWISLGFNDVVLLRCVRLIQFLSHSNTTIKQIQLRNALVRHCGMPCSGTAFCRHCLVQAWPCAGCAFLHMLP